ncbi:MAG: hypothetical protein PWQ75_1050 [Methanolobus sp.]|jgi:hypothetical protein|uniref:hypothetical protein n=1 Tax=Methanolobus sp. TaxID=1874737 RepID=UPI00258E1B34|nr:hypothetical protein [Methanolobus sp.]MDK2831298.1 hypothetical protein [Methanolobus sp.]
MSESESLKDKLTFPVEMRIAYFRNWLGYNLKKAFMTVIIILAVEILLLFYLYDDVVTGASLVTLFIVLLTFLDVPSYLESAQYVKKNYDLENIELLENGKLKIVIKNVSSSWSKMLFFDCIISDGNNVVSNEFYNSLDALGPDQTYDEVIDVSSLDSGVTYTVKVLLDSWEYTRKIKI